MEMFLIELNILLSLVFLGYVLFLKRLTYFNHIRVYFIGGLISVLLFSIVKHLISDRYIKTFTKEITVDISEFSETTQYSNYIGYLIAIVSFYFLAKIIVSLVQLKIIDYNSVKETAYGIEFQKVNLNIPPFTFLNKIYINPNLHSEEELKHIILHENVHAQELHSVDLLLGQLIIILAWFNPLVWMMNKSINENLEYLTDEFVLDEGANRKIYQYSLLKVSDRSRFCIVANHFNTNFLKKRIFMMNKPRSERHAVALFFILIPMYFSMSAFVSFSYDKMIEMDLSEGIYSLYTPPRVAIKQDSISSGYATTLYSKVNSSGSRYVAVAKVNSGKVKFKKD